MEMPKDRDFIETVEGFLFCVVGYLHPLDRYTAYLKYIPSAEGKWGKEGTRYARVLPYYHVSQVENTYDFLRNHHPQYLLRCPVRNITISSVPYPSVRNYFRPRERLKSILAKEGKDALELKLIDLVSFLSDYSGIGQENIGVTGSLLTENHNPEFSDIDLTVYGRDFTQRLKNAIIKARKEDEPIGALSQQKMAEWSRGRSEKFSLNPEDLMIVAKRRWNYGTYKGTYFSVHPIRTDEEITERYGDLTYHQKGLVRGSAEICDNCDSIYLPAIYKVDKVHMEPEKHVCVEQLVSYEGIFCDIFKEGEKVEFQGNLEEVSGKRDFYRIVVGGAGSSNGYIKLST
jgi:predicted nucleotidyltransferase